MKICYNSKSYLRVIGRRRITLIIIIIIMIIIKITVKNYNYLWFIYKKELKKNSKKPER